MKTTTEQDRELGELLRELRMLFVRPTSDGNGNAQPEMERIKTADLLKLTSRLASLARETSYTRSSKTNLS